MYKLQKRVLLRHQSYLIVFMGNKNLGFWQKLFAKIPIVTRIRKIFTTQCFLTNRINANHILKTVLFVHISPIPLNSLIQKEINTLFEIILTAKSVNVVCRFVKLL